MILMSQRSQVIGTYEAPSIKGFSRRHFTVEEGKEAAEVFICSNYDTVMPVGLWDDTEIYNGQLGPGVQTLKALYTNHIDPQSNTGQHLEVPYGYLTGMEHY